MVLYDNTINLSLFVILIIKIQKPDTKEIPLVRTNTQEAAYTALYIFYFFQNTHIQEEQRFCAQRREMAIRKSIYKAHSLGFTTTPKLVMNR